MADDVTVGPYTIIEDHVSIGKGTVIGGHCFIGSYTTLGERNRVFTGAVVGSITQDLKYKGERTYLTVGNDNIIREYVTMNRSSNKDQATTIGNGNLFMAYSHVAHDCLIGNGVIVANCGTLAGYVTLEDKVIIGGLGGVHQFVRIGTYAIIGGCSKAVQDIPPYCMADGHPAQVRGINSIGLKRAGFSTAKIRAIKKAIKLLCFSNITKKTALGRITKSCGSAEEINYIVRFVERSKRGITKND
jgi:UDP-N-acetylglucosamine acyltransferase